MEFNKKYKDHIEKKSIYSILYRKQPEFFSSTLSYIITSINYFLFLYIIFSFLIYLFFHFFALNINTFKFTESTYSPYDSSLSMNNYNNLFLLVIIGFGILALKQETIFYFLLYIGTFGFFTLSFIFNANHTFLSRLSYSYMVYHWIMISCFGILSVYCLMYYMKLIGYIKFNLNDIPFDDIIHEVKLRIDMAKISYNGLLIKYGIHKISKKLLYSPKEYYFMNIERERENNETIKKEFLGEKSFSKSTCGNNSFSTKSEDETYATTVENNYSRMESEYEPLKN